MRTWGTRSNLFGILFCLVLFFNLNPVLAQEVGGISTATSHSAPTINTFQFTGAAVGSIPIIVPPGRNGIAPRLALTYNSYRRNGWIGVGWGLGMGAIQRSTRRGVCYECDDYVASMNGSSSELVPRPEWGANYYGAKIEGAFTKYYKVTNGWEVTTKDGMKYYYGQSQESRQDDPQNSARVFKWCLDRAEDTNGNYMEVEYEKRPDGLYTGQIYLTRIEYTGHASLGPSNAVKFYLQDRPDAGAMLTTNFKVITAKRLSAIEITANGELARAYRLEYTQSSSTLRSLLNNVVQFGSDANIDDYGKITEGSVLPAISFDWQNDTSNSFTNVYFTSSTMEGYSIGSKRDRAFAFDYNGDGKKDLFFYRPDSGYVGVNRSNGDGTFTNVYLSTSGIAGYDLRGNQDQVFPFDYNGDGLSDLFLYRPDSNIACVARSNGDGSFSHVYFSFSGMAGYSIGSKRDRAFPFDYNGDGKSDIFLYRPDSGYVGVNRSNGDGTFTNVYLSTSGIAGYDLRGNRDQIFPFDYNGDGLSDLFLYRPDSNVACVARSNGDGSFSSVYFSFSGMAGYSIGSKRDRAFAFDYNGDGKSDIFLYRPDSGYVGVIRSNGDGTFTNVYLSTSGIAGYDLRGNRDQVFPFDYNGDGSSDLFLFRPDSGIACVARSNGDGTFSNVFFSNSGIAGYDLRSERDQAFSFDYNGNGKGDIFLYRPDSYAAMVVRSGQEYPDLLTTIRNGAGATTTVQYANSSIYQNFRLPFIVHPVRSISVDDGVGGGSAVQFNYMGGQFDYGAREFRGFQTATQTNPDGTVKITNFFQGRDDDDEEDDDDDEALPGDNYFFKGQAASVEFKESSEGSCPDSGCLSRTEFDLEIYPETPAEDSWAFVKLVGKSTISYDDVATAVEEAYEHDDSNGNLNSVVTSGTDAESIIKTFEYDNYGSEEYPIWRKTSENMEGTSSGLMRQAWFDYNSSGNLIREEHWNNNPDDPINPVLKMKYDAYGNQTESWEAKSSHLYPNNPTVTIQYDPETHTYPVRITNPLGHTVEYEYNNPFGTVSAERDSNGNLTYYHYDPFGRLELTELPNGGETTVDWEDHVFPRYLRTSVKEDDSGSTIDAYEYFDGLGRSLQTISFGENGKPIVTKARYDEMGRVEQSWGPFFSTFIGYHSDGYIPDNVPYVKTDYDLRSRPLRIESPLGKDVDSATIAVTIFSYSGLSTTVTDPDGGKKTEKKDYLGRVKRVTEYSDSGELYTDYQYNAAAELLSVTDAMGNETSMDYDSLGRKIGMTDPDMGSWHYTYDANGNLKTQTDAKGDTITFVYDKLDRVTDKTYSTSPAIDPPVKYTYDEASVQYGIGRLYKVENANASTTIDAYDETGQELSVTQRITGAPLSAYTTTYSYDYSGKVKSMVYPGTTPYQVNYEYYPGSGLLHTVTGITDFTEYAELSGYEPTGKIGEIYHGNGAQTFYSFDPKSTRLLSIQTTGPVMENIQNKAYKYTAAGDIALITDTKDAQVITYNYGYDKLHRLISETNTGAADNFDPAMLIKTYDDTEPIHAVKSVNLNGMDKPYEYDRNGNMAEGWDFSDPVQPVKRQIDYNADNMPVQISHLRSSGKVTVDLSYDGEGVRVKKSIQGGSATYYIGEHFEVAGGVETKYIFAGNLRIAKVTSSTKQFYHKDHLGSTTVATTFPGGLEIETAEYLPFGLFRNHSETEVTYYKFSDQELDAEVGLYNFNARLYDPAIGTFISPDSIVPDFTNPQSLNRYSYCYNNPLSYVDPDGHFGFLASIVVGAVIGAISAGAQSDWDPGTMAIGAMIGGVSGGVFSGVSGAAGSYVSHIGLAGGMGPPTAGMMTAGGVGGAIAGGAAGGATAGGLSAAYYRGDIGQGMLQGAGYGALSGAAFGAIGGYYGDNWTLGRVAMHGLAGGGISELSGNDFLSGAMYTGASAALYWGYSKMVGIGPDFLPGEKLAGGTYDPRANGGRPPVGKNVFALNKPLTRNFWKDFWTQGGPLSKVMNLFPGMNATAGLHDYWMNNVSFNMVTNVGTMLPAAAMAYGSVLGGAFAPITVPIRTTLQKNID